MSEKTQSMIGQFFNGKSVLITGATGLVGKLIAWKLLHSCTGIERIYVIIRPKNGKTIDERLNELTSKSRDLFNYIDSKLLDKIIPIKGDTSLPQLGLNTTDKEIIINKVSIVFHSAADITFQADLKEQIFTNVGGTKEIYDLCGQIKKLDAFIHVSTAYCNPNQSVTEEIIYENRVDPHEMIEMAKKTDAIKNINYLGEFPNTYTFTKNLAEHLVLKEWSTGKLPTAIVRPGIVCPSFAEPESGWIDSLNGISGAILMLAVGLARTGRINLNAKPDPIPVDIVANTCITAAWLTATKYASEVRVYNCNSCCSGNMLNGREMQRVAYDWAYKYPLLKTIRPIATPTSEFWMFPIIFHLTKFFSETCFAYLCDFVLLLIGEKRFVAKLMKRFHRINHVMEYFVTREWFFTNRNFVQMHYDQIGTDRTVYYCDVRDIDWIQFGQSAYFMARKIFLKEKDDDVQKAQIRMKYITIGYTIVNYIFIFIIWYLITSIIPWKFPFSDELPLSSTKTVFLLTFISALYSILETIFYDDN